MRIDSFVIRQLCQLHATKHTPAMVAAAKHEEFNPDNFMTEWWRLQTEAVKTKSPVGDTEVDELRRIGDYMRAQLRALNAERALRRAVRMMQKAHVDSTPAMLKGIVLHMAMDELEKTS